MAQISDIDSKIISRYIRGHFNGLWLQDTNYLMDYYVSDLEKHGYTYSRWPINVQKYISGTNIVRTSTGNFYRSIDDDK